MNNIRNNNFQFSIFNFQLHKRLAIFSIAIMLVVLAIATVIEKFKGAAFVATHIYDSWLFIGLWFVIALSAFICIIQKKMYKRPMVFLMHLSFIVILLGAFITFTTSVQGTMHLRMGKPANAFLDKNTDVQQTLPFDMTLTDFRVEYYPGTTSPSDYVSEFTILHKNEETIGKVSMNKVCSKLGYRFYQAGYDRDQQGTILLIKSDRYGLPITYCGYALLFTSILGFFFSRKTAFSALLQHPALKRVGMFVTFLMLTGLAVAENPRTLPKETARKLGELQMLYQDRISPVQSFAKDFTLKLYGKTTYKGLTSEQVLSGWLLYFEDWINEPMLKIKGEQVRDILGINGKYASFADFFTNHETYKLEKHLAKIYSGVGQGTPREIFTADEKIQLIYMLKMGTLLKIFPYMQQENLIWFSPGEVLPEEIPEGHQLLVSSILGLLNEYVDDGDISAVDATFDKLLLFQQKNAGELLISTSKISAERLYNHLNFAKSMAMMNLLIGILALIYFTQSNYQPSLSRLRAFALIILIFDLVLVITLIVLRGYISGRVPMGTGYETMQFLAACILLLAILFQKKLFLTIPFGFVFSGLVLLVSGLGAANPQITHLQPVLMSPLLSVHVSLIMISYTLLGFITLNGLAALTTHIVEKRKHPEATQARLLQLSVISRILLYPAVFLLAAGIFVGAIWAEVSWGNYWTWDPKETWALITMMIYALPLHASILPRFQRPLFLHIYFSIAFLTVLMTYFGVNYLLGGMHSYGSIH